MAFDRKAYDAQNRERRRETQRTCRQRTRKECLAHYGGKCACCGETESAFLGIDHINGGGGKHRKSLGHWGVNFYAWLRREGWPDGYQVLCHNCNQAKGYYGVCPHRSK